MSTTKSNNIMLSESFHFIFQSHKMLVEMINDEMSADLAVRDLFLRYIQTFK